jgi:hypothetical protein
MKVSQSRIYLVSSHEIVTNNSSSCLCCEISSISCTHFEHHFHQAVSDELTWMWKRNQSILSTLTPHCNNTRPKWIYGGPVASSPVQRTQPSNGMSCPWYLLSKQTPGQALALSGSMMYAGIALLGWGGGKTRSWTFHRRRSFLVFVSLWRWISDDGLRSRWEQ